MKMIAAALLLALAPSSRAADGTGTKAQKQVDDLSQGISRPEDFENFVQGSRELQALSQQPAADATRSAAGRTTAPASRLDQFSPGRAPQRSALPPAPLTAQERPARSNRRSENPLEKEAALLGLTGALLLAASFYKGTPRTASLPKPQRPAQAFERPRPTPPARSLSSDLPETQVYESPTIFVDTRMPAPTWRAITLQEQRLIDGWNASREKAQGHASLEDWIEARADAAGVDGPSLKAKLFRDA